MVLLSAAAFACHVGRVQISLLIVLTIAPDVRRLYDC